MGNRASVSFKKDDEESVAIFSHWGGEEFQQSAIDYVNNLKERKAERNTTPLDRLEPGTVAIDFIRHITKDLKEVESNLYVEKNKNEGDNSDNGHEVISLD